MKDSIEKLIVKKTGPLKGEVTVSGAKNSALPILAASLLSTKDVILRQVPKLKDVEIMIEVLKSLGSDVVYLDDTTLKINSKNVNTYETPFHLMDKMRASFVVMGPLLSRLHKTKTKAPGGCNIGKRPIDLHLKGFSSLGATTNQTDDEISAYVKDGLKGANIYLDFPSVGATQNIMMAATLAKGRTVIDNAAKEPEIVDLSNFLNKLGAKIKGAGTSTIVIDGVKQLYGTDHTIIPDRIEAITFMIAAAITRGDVVIKNVIVSHIRPIIAKLIEVGCEIEENLDEDTIRVRAFNKLKSTSIKTLPYPGFPTDAQSQFMSLMCVCDGKSEVKETVFENRFMHVEELNRMGAAIITEGNTALIIGVDELKGAKVKATDLRAGAALVLSGLVASGETVISDIYHIDRGYSDLVAKFRSLGADIKRV